MIYLPDEYTDCIVGTVSRAGEESYVIYCSDKVIDKLMLGGMNYEDAIDFFNFNMLGAWMGEGTPGFLFEEDVDAY